MNDKTTNSNDIRTLIQEYLLEEGILRNKIENDNIEFGYRFIFPPAPPNQKLKQSQSMVVFQPKHKNDMLIISIGTQINPAHVEALKKKEVELLFFNELKKLLHLKDLFFYIDSKNFRYEISEQTFVENNYLTKNSFYSLIRKVFNIQAYSNLMLLEFCSGEGDLQSFDPSAKFDPGSGFSLYT
ncbi:MAG: hypothetical protein BAJALOKI1v1_1520009 [Promethearchaeota archaeon]|nr:MAG: hypothetical protein BAJALOKI1v1_1520009 [Candidatus Lokiarchaeota archaeon]